MSLSLWLSTFLLLRRRPGPAGEWLRVATERLHLVSVYRRPGITLETSQEFCKTLTEDLATLGTVPFLVAGEFNHDPRGDRMGVPSQLLHAWDRAWRNQARWLCAAGAVGVEACKQVWCLPQGDAASPMA